MDSNPFVITVHVHYKEMFVPPRCRKARPRAAEADLTFEVAQVTGEQAPVVLQVPDLADYNTPGVVWADVRGYDGNLYVPLSSKNTRYPAEATVVAGSGDYPAAFETRDYDWYQLSDHEEVYADRFGRHLIIDGKVWKQTTEPVYAIHYFGFAPHLVLDRVNSPYPEFPLTDLDDAVAYLRGQSGSKDFKPGDEPFCVRYPVRVLDASYLHAPHRADVVAARTAEAQAMVDEAIAVLTDTTLPLLDRTERADRLVREASSVLGRD